MYAHWLVEHTCACASLAARNGGFFPAGESLAAVNALPLAPEAIAAPALSGAAVQPVLGEQQVDSFLPKRLR